MALAPRDRKFLHTVDRFKVYLLVIAGGVLLFLLITPGQETRLVTSVIGVVLCGIFWLTQRLLSYITVLDLELSRLANAIKRSLTEEERREFFAGRTDL
jgi:hypothetical protein